MKKIKKKERAKRIKIQQDEFKKANKKHLREANSPERLISLMGKIIVKHKRAILRDRQKLFKLSWRLISILLGLIVSSGLLYQYKSWLAGLFVSYFLISAWKAGVSWIETRSSLLSWMRTLQEDSENLDLLWRELPKNSCGCTHGMSSDEIWGGF